MNNDPGHEHDLVDPDGPAPDGDAESRRLGVTSRLIRGLGSVAAFGASLATFDFVPHNPYNYTSGANLAVYALLGVALYLGWNAVTGRTFSSIPDSE